MPQMLRDILRGLLEGHEDIAILGDARSDEELLAAMSHEAPDVVVVESPRGCLGLAGALVLQGRPTSVLAFSADARSAVVYQVKVGEVVVREVSPAGLREAIREAVVLQV
jgi:DNA-binding NarL/FixJ family response regulator